MLNLCKGYYDVFPDTVPILTNNDKIIDALLSKLQYSGKAFKLIPDSLGFTPNFPLVKLCFVFCDCATLNEGN